LRPPVVKRNHSHKQSLSHRGVTAATSDKATEQQLPSFEDTPDGRVGASEKAKMECLEKQKHAGLKSVLHGG